MWESKCGKTGNCWVYDHDKFRNYLHGTALTFMMIGSFFDFITIFYAGRVRNFYEDDDEVEKANKELNHTEMNMLSLLPSGENAQDGPP